MNFIGALTPTTQNGCGDGISATPDLIEQYSPIISDKFFYVVIRPNEILYKYIWRTHLQYRAGARGTSVPYHFFYFKLR